MFGNSKNNNVKSTKTNNTAPSGSAVNQLSDGTQVKGTIRSKSDIRIDGLFEGEIFCDNKVVIGRNGKVVGKINCQNADIQGRVEGELTSQAVTILRTSAYLKGNIGSEKLMIENGATFNGNCVMTNQAEQQKQAPKQQPQQKQAAQ